MKKPIAIAVITVSFLLTGGAALALTGSPSAPPSNSNATNSSSSSSHSDSESSDAESSDTESSNDPSPSSSSHPDNHGAAVSKAAHDCPPGPGHGACVSAVAHHH